MVQITCPGRLTGGSTFVTRFGEAEPIKSFEALGKQARHFATDSRLGVCHGYLPLEAGAAVEEEEEDRP